MAAPLILASGSEIRQQMLKNAGLSFTCIPAQVDEHALRAALVAEGATPRDLADTLAEFKARRVGAKHPEAQVIGCDQVLEFQGRTLAKPKDVDDARSQLVQLRGKSHTLVSAVVIFHEGRPVWRHVGEVRMGMRAFSDAYLDDYLARHWDSVRHSVGCYRLEEEGIRLFTRVDGDYFTVLGLPLLALLSYLTTNGTLPE